MILRRIAIGSSLLASLAMAGCAGEKGDGMNDDPLVGNWSNDTCYGSEMVPEGIESCSTELNLKDDLEVELVTEEVSLPATEKLPGCTTTRRITGQRWSTDHATNTLTITGTGNATLERKGCVHEEDNRAAEPTGDIELRPGKMKYELRGDSLKILDGSLAGTYSR